MRKKIAYLNPDCYVDVDMTVLGAIARVFDVVWYAVYYTDRPTYYDAAQMSEYAARYGIQLRLFPRRYRQRDPRNLSFYREIVRDINAERVNLVYTCLTDEIYWTLASRKLNAALVLGLHDVRMHDFGKPLKRMLQTAMREFAIRSAKNVCVFSENQRKLFSRIYGRDAVQLALCSRRLGPSSRTYPPVSEGMNLLFFGNILEYKGLDTLIHCMEKLRSDGVDNLRLTIAGTGEHWKICEQLVRTPDMYDTIIRFIRNDEIPDLMASHHFLVLPYRNATQSGPLALALGHGIPVLAPAYGCFTEYCDARSAILYGDIEEGLRMVAGLDDTAYEALRWHASAQDTRFSEEAVARKYIDCFNSI